ncbi:hypothetical protein HYALB_00000935 [Hymenoscyphus albidus]|uniref:DUF7726 domain-containing protein n=1 Tax=Hymenoscyphus albidus TaxID=595503 RepID=A0A9N9L985_9HELO|nr:hypothetical protein HYALB_00000935 [Hymenoscyphus albidus]
MSYYLTEAEDGTDRMGDMLAWRRDANGKLMSSASAIPTETQRICSIDQDLISRGLAPTVPITGNRSMPSSDSLPPPALHFADVAAPSTSSLKRKSDTFAANEDSDDEHYYFPADQCDVVRRKLRNLRATGEITQGKLCEKLGVSAKSYRTFMGMNGKTNGKTKGLNTATYGPAYRYFQKQEMTQGPVPKKRAKKADEEAENSISIRLDGEDTVSVPVFDSCDEVRKKIEAHLRMPNVSNAGFRREIAKTYPEAKAIQSKVLNDFLNKTGPSAGNTSSVFYAAYVYFEKMRLRGGNVKSKHRIEMEKRHPNGFDTKRRNEGRYYTCMEGQKISVTEDKFGVSHVHRY